MQFLCNHGYVECPVCGVALELVSEQDVRVAQMRHRPQMNCCLESRVYRIDRRTGYGEVLNEA